MNNLVIELTGEIQNSNFDAWKNQLVEQIQSVSKELSTDSDFVQAGKNVKQFKAAEKALKAAKQSAIEQAADINRLLDAIDAVAEETRQVRLSLERQIKTRKKAIKREFVTAGIAEIEKFIAVQHAEFQLISHQTYLDDDQFEDATRSKPPKLVF